MLKIKLNSNWLKIEPDGRGGSVLIIEDGVKWQLEGNGKEIMCNTTGLEREDIISILNDHYQDEREVA
ncbi:hypothetical protein [Xenorhabdus bovienii]|uniref:hypothetical protein n=1 Tax=Xenorhabdus bovienii TaxID=40576 RepID=UPI000AB49DFE|nr:hypothetical protein [Xenorhabdus bovienii]